MLYKITKFVLALWFIVPVSHNYKEIIFAHISSVSIIKLFHKSSKTCFSTGLLA